MFLSENSKCHFHNVKLAWRWFDDQPLISHCEHETTNMDEKKYRFKSKSKTQNKTIKIKT
jgi:hypothetical protein